MRFRFFYLFGIAVIFYNLTISLYHLFTGDVLFHTDIARGFLLVEDMVKNGRPDLIGPRAGGIPGLFFGPIWYWIMIPIFFVGNGSPVFMGYFWYILVVALLIIVYIYTSKIFGKRTGFVSLVLMSFYALDMVHGFTQSFLSLLFSPILFYLIYKFYKTHRLKYFSLLVLVLGFIFQLQPAFGMIMLFLTFVFSLFWLVKIKRRRYIYAYLLLLIPFSTYIVFELRHNFLEIRAFTSFLLNAPADRQSIDMWSIFLNRVDGFLGRLNLLEGGFSMLWQSLLFLGINIFVFVKALKEKVHGKEFYLIFYIYYFAYWIVSFAFKGVVWDFYHWAFLPLVIMIFASLYNLINKKFFVLIFGIVCLILYTHNVISLKSWIYEFSGRDSSSWLLKYNIAKFVYADAKSDFGYYVFSSDDLGYSMRYAMNYSQKFSVNNANLCRKLPITYLIYSPEAVKGSGVYWKTKKVNINIKPVESEMFGPVKVEKYKLDSSASNTASDPYILCDLSFR